MPAVGERGRYQVGARNAATAATANHVLAALWNPHATKDIYAVWLLVSSVSGFPVYYLRRTTTRGTVGSTTTPGIGNDVLNLAAPVSGAGLDLAAYSAQPTIDASLMYRVKTGVEAGSAAGMWFPSGIRIKAGTGLAIVQGAAIAWVADVMFGWDE